jgi:hypothetical protein
MDSELEHALVVLRYWFGPDLARDLNVTPRDRQAPHDPSRRQWVKRTWPGAAEGSEAYGCVGRRSVTQPEVDPERLAAA